METIKIIQIRQIIKIFLASSKELCNDRYAFGNFVRRLNKTYEKRGIRLDLFEWEDYDAAHNNRRKQDEYNDQIRDSDMFLALFRTWAGKFTIEEFDVAVEEFRRTGTKPKNYVYIRDLFEGEVETDELFAFKHRLSDEMGYFWIRYNNNDSLQLHFVMQLQLVEGNRIDSLKVENGEVKFEDMTIAQMDNLRFAAGNEEYKRMNQRLAELPGLIEKARMRVENYPNEEDFKDGLQELLNERNQLQKDFDQQQQFLLDTAMRIARLQGEKITDRMRRAMEAFEEGKVHEANIILDEAEHDADRNLTDYHQSKELTEQKRQNVINSIDELLLKTSIIMADATIPIGERINQTKGLYAKADQLASEVDYAKEKYFDLMFDYARFLNHYGLYHDAKSVCLRQIEHAENLYGKENENTATCYNNIGVVYENKGDYAKALEYYLKALKIDKKVLGTEHPNTATTYNNLGMIYYDLGNYEKALELCSKTLTIHENVFGKEHVYTALSYNNIGMVYHTIGNYDLALENYHKALDIRKKTLKTNHYDIAVTYDNIGGVYCSKGDYNKALEYHLKAMEIFEETIGTNHPDSASTYCNIGVAYSNLSDYGKALKYHIKASEIREKTLGTEHILTAQSYNNIGLSYYHLVDYGNALKYYFKAMAIMEIVLGTNHPDVATSYDNIGIVYNNRGEYNKALEYQFRALAIYENTLGTNHPETATSYNNIGGVYWKQGDNDKAIEYILKALAIQEKVLGMDHPNTAKSYNNIGVIYYLQHDYKNALKYLNMAYITLKKVFGPKHYFYTESLLLRINEIKQALDSSN